MTPITGDCFLREGCGIFMHPSDYGWDLLCRKKNYFRGWRWIPDLQTCHINVTVRLCLPLRRSVEDLFGSSGICRVWAPITGEEPAVAAAFKVDCRSFESFRSPRYPRRGLCAMDNCSRIPGRPWVAPQRGCTYSGHITKAKMISLANHLCWSPVLVPEQWHYGGSERSAQVVVPAKRLLVLPAGCTPFQASLLTTRMDS